MIIHLKVRVVPSALHVRARVVSHAQLVMVKKGRYFLNSIFHIECMSNLYGWRCGELQTLPRAGEPNLYKL